MAAEILSELGPHGSGLESPRMASGICRTIALPPGLAYPHGESNPGYHLERVVS